MENRTRFMAKVLIFLALSFALLLCFKGLRAATIYQDTVKIALIYDKPHIDSVFTEIGWVVRRNYQGQMKEIKWLLRDKSIFPTQYKLTDWGYFKN